MLLHLGCDSDFKARVAGIQSGFVWKKGKKKTSPAHWWIHQQLPVMVCNLHFGMCVSVCFFYRESSSLSLLLEDPRVNLLTNGGLEISNVSHDDEGTYTCFIQNSNVSVGAELEVLSEWQRLSCSGRCYLLSLPHRWMPLSCLFSRQDSDPVAPTSSEDAAW